MISQRPEDVLRNLLRSGYHNAQHSAVRLTARRPMPLSKPCACTRQLSALPRSKSCLGSPIGRRTVCGGSHVAYNGRKQPFATTCAGETKPREIAVLGAGITGLTAAHYLARHAENAHITIYEASSSPGGWIKADRVEVEDGEGQRGHVLLQKGPRMLRPSGSSTKYDDLVLYDVVS